MAETDAKYAKLRGFQDQLVLLQITRLLEGREQESRQITRREIHWLTFRDGERGHDE
jgi:hypothetical protein